MRRRWRPPAQPREEGVTLRMMGDQGAGGVGLERTGEREAGGDLRRACRVATAKLSRQSSQVPEVVVAARGGGGVRRMGVGRIWNWGPTGRRLRWGLRGGRGPARPAMPPGPASGRPSPPRCPPHPVASPAPEGAGAKASASAPPPGLSRSKTRVS